MFGLFVAGALLPAFFPQTALTPQVVRAAKIAPEVLKGLQAAPAGKTAVFVLLTDQADLTPATQFEEWEVRGEAVYQILRATAAQSQPAVMAKVADFAKAGHVAQVEQFWIVNLLAMHADAQAVQGLAALPQVKAILPVAKLEAPTLTLQPDTTSQTPQAVEWNIARIRAPEVWSAYTTGTGVVVANVDTGVDHTHPALVNQYRGNLGNGLFEHNHNWFDPTGASTDPRAVLGNPHGTHVMGTEVGSDGGANEIGVAPGARWIAAFGCCPDNQTLLAAMQWMLAPTDLEGNDPRPAMRPHVLNHSWGGPGGSQIFGPAIMALHTSGIFQSFSAGNSGSATTCGRIGSPGDNPLAFQVGATDASDTIASFSARGPDPFTGDTAPDLTAPGSSIRSSLAGGNYGSSNGTSMAAPHVAGAAALLIATEPKLRGQIAQLQELLQRTAVPLTSTQNCGGVPGSAVPNNVYGWGRIDVKAAADLVWQAGWLSGIVTANGTPLADAEVRFTRGEITLTTHTDAQGRYRVVAGAGSWTLSATTYGHGETIPVPVSVTQNATTTQDLALPSQSLATLSGQLTQEGSGAEVPAMVMVAAHDQAAPVWAGADGRYQLDLPPGDYTLVVVHPGYQTLQTPITISGNQTLNLSLTPLTNYTCLDNRAPGGPTFDWIDVTDGTPHPLSDDAETTITLPQPFTYFGTAYSSLALNSNGFLTFGSSSPVAHMVLPFEGRPNNDVMAFGEDLNPENGSQGQIYTKQVGNRFVLAWVDVEHWSHGFPETFEIVLDLSTGSITYQYQELTWPDYTSVGLENETGQVGQLYSYANSATLTAGRAVRFDPASGVAVNWGCDHAFMLKMAAPRTMFGLGEPITYTLQWDNIGFGGAPNATITATLPSTVTLLTAPGATVDGATLTWNLGNLRPKSTGDLWFAVRAEAGPQVTIPAAISDSSGQARHTAITTAILTGPTALDLVDLNAASSPWRFSAGLALALALVGALALWWRRPTP